MVFLMYAHSVLCEVQSEYFIKLFISVFKRFNILLAGPNTALFFIHTFVSRLLNVKVIMNCELGTKWLKMHF